MKKIYRATIYNHKKDFSYIIESYGKFNTYIDFKNHIENIIGKFYNYNSENIKHIMDITLKPIINPNQQLLYLRAAAKGKPKEIEINDYTKVIVGNVSFIDKSNIDRLPY